MEVSEFLSSVASGTRFSAVIPTDMESLLRQSLITGLISSGYTVHPCQGCAAVIDRVQTPNLDDDGQHLDAYIVQFPSTDQDIKAVTSLAGCLSRDSGTVLLVETEDYPPKKTKSVASLLSKATILEATENAGTIPWVTAQAAAAGLQLSARCAALLQARIAGCPAATFTALRTLKHYCSGSSLVSEKDIEDSVPFHVDPEDGRAVLDDLLNQRVLSLSRRVSVMPESRMVSLFRVATAELTLIHQVATLLASSDKGRFDSMKASESLGVAEDRIRSRYLPLAKTLGVSRSKAMLDTCSKADTLLLRSPHDSRVVAMSLALNICRQ